MEKIAIIFDCGATNVRVIAMNNYGEIKASKSFPNLTVTDPHYANGRIWDLYDIWKNLCTASQYVTSKIDTNSIVAVTTTSFGVDGTFIDTHGNLLYPVISWQCERTQSTMRTINKYIPVEELYGINGVNAYSFNTINKLIWLKENLPEIIDNADRFLFMPSLLNFLLTGIKYNDWSMLGTSMLTDIFKQSLSTEILKSIDIKAELFNPIGQAGQIIGNIKNEAFLLTGIPEGTPVCLTGHDTQFAIFGSGAEINQPVLSSGTWEILMVRSKHFSTSLVQLDAGITTEFDAVSGLYNIGLNWLGSGIIEWIRNKFFYDCSSDNCYDIMIDEAKGALPGANDVFINPDFNSIKNPDLKGVIGGLTINTTRGEIMRAAFEALAFQTKNSLKELELSGNFTADKLICVGGGSKNNFWNQLRTDILGIPVITIDQKETTALGASFFAFKAAGLYEKPEEWQQNISYNGVTTHPSKDANLYSKLYQQWQKKIKL